MNQQTIFKQTEIGEIPEDWDVKELQEEVDVNMGQSPKSEFYNASGEGCLFMQGVRTFGEKYPTFDTYTTQITKEAKAGSVLFSVRAPVGEVNITEKNLCIGRGLSALNMKNGNNEFLYYLLKKFKTRILNFETGSVFGAINGTQIKGLKLPFPEETEQKAIAKVLSDFDSKIELLQKQNKTLEAIGQAIFKHWFVDFEFPNEGGKPYKSSGGEMVFNEELGKEIPKGWGVGEFSELVDYKKDSLKAGESLKDRKYVPIDTLPMKKMGLESYKDYTEAQSSLIAFEKDDILFGAMRPYFHRVNISPFSGVTRTTCFVLRPKKPRYLSYSILLLFQDSSIDYANAHSTGSTIPYAVWNNSLEVMPVLKPKDEIIKKFDDLFYPTLSKIRDSIFEMQTLSQIRDSLLPKLMSGKIRVPVEVK